MNCQDWSSYLVSSALARSNADSMLIAEPEEHTQYFKRDTNQIYAAQYCQRHDINTKFLCGMYSLRPQALQNVKTAAVLLCGSVKIGKELYGICKAHLRNGQNISSCKGMSHYTKRKKLGPENMIINWRFYDILWLKKWHNLPPHTLMY